MKLTKQVILFSILLFFTANIGYKSICLFKNSTNSYSFIDNKDVNSEEQNSESEKSESEKSNEKTDSDEFDKDFNHHLYPSNLFISSNSLNIHHVINFSSADYSQVIYSPPEQL